MTDLRTLVYVSTAVTLFTEKQLESLLVEARSLNLDNGITGVLLYSDGNFMQCLEGQVDSVQAALDRIRASRSHFNLITLIDQPIAGRCFADWNMGFAHATRSELLALTTARWQDSSTGSAAASPGLALLQGFWARR